MSDSLPCNPNDVPNEPRAFSMPQVSQDRHTRRGNLSDTTDTLKKRCEKLRVEVPKNEEYSHGPSAHKTRQGFEEFMEHIQTCEDQTSDGREPVFKEEALRLYRAQSIEEEKKWIKIFKRKFEISDVKPRKRLAGKGKRKEDALKGKAKKQRMSQEQKDSYDNLQTGQNFVCTQEIERTLTSIMPVEVARFLCILFITKNRFQCLVFLEP